MVVAVVQVVQMVPLFPAPCFPRALAAPPPQPPRPSGSLCLLPPSLLGVNELSWSQRLIRWTKEGSEQAAP